MDSSKAVAVPQLHRSRLEPGFRTLSNFAGYGFSLVRTPASYSAVPDRREVQYHRHDLRHP